MVAQHFERDELGLAWSYRALHGRITIEYDHLDGGFVIDGFAGSLGVFALAHSATVRNGR